jgi:prepilin-type N-terminal cleavage/methylation domain-containing protein
MKPMNKNNKGFTLAELLIVVAIIAVLVAVSIPVFTGQMEKARLATNRANIRAAKAAAYVYYAENGFPKASDTRAYYIYDINSGSITLYSSSSGSTYNPPETKDKNKYGENAVLKNGIYQSITVYIHEGDTDTKYTIQTNPHYDSKTNSMVFVTGKAYM